MKLLSIVATGALCLGTSIAMAQDAGQGAGTNAGSNKSNAQGSSQQSDMQDTGHSKVDTKEFVRKAPLDTMKFRWDN